LYGSGEAKEEKIAIDLGQGETTSGERQASAKAPIDKGRRETTSMAR
jgi:hypothetical protein